MGFSGGASIAEAVIKAAQTNVPDVAARKAVYAALIAALEDADWDTQCEVRDIDPAFDETLERLHAHGN